MPDTNRRERQALVQRDRKPYALPGFGIDAVSALGASELHLQSLRSSVLATVLSIGWGSGFEGRRRAGSEWMVSLQLL